MSSYVNNLKTLNEGSPSPVTVKKSALCQYCRKVTTDTFVRGQDGRKRWKCKACLGKKHKTVPFSIS